MARVINESLSMIRNEQNLVEMPEVPPPCIHVTYASIHMRTQQLLLGTRRSRRNISQPMFFAGLIHLSNYTLWAPQVLRLLHRLGR